MTPDFRIADTGQVEDLKAAAKPLRERGWNPDGTSFEILNGPCFVLDDPRGKRFRFVENIRPKAFERNSDWLFLEAVRVPVVAAGGIGTGRAMAAALAAGASAVRVGTRFVAATESEAHPSYIEKLMGAEAKDTILTEAFSANWPNAPHRVLRSSVEAAQNFPGAFVGERVYAWDPDVRIPVARFASLVPMQSCTGEIDAMPHWAGESVGGVTRIQPAADIVRELVGEAERLLRRALRARPRGRGTRRS